MTRTRIIAAVFLAGIAYLVIGLVSAALAGRAGLTPMRTFWRLSAFIASGIIFLAHIAHEHFRLRSLPVTTAWHTSAAVAFGGFALAVAAIVHSYIAGTGQRGLLTLALIMWPLITGTPAFVAAFVLTYVARKYALSSAR